MALSTYTGLQASVADYLARSDLNSQITDFISLTEAKLQRRFKAVTALSSINSTNWLLTAHPDAYLYGALLEAAPYLLDDSRLAMWATALEKVLAEIRHPDSGSNFSNYTGLKLAIADWLNRPDIDSNIPNFIALIEAKLQRRFVGVTNLSVSYTTNWVLTSHPDLYLYGSLLEAAPYLKDDERLTIWATTFEKLIGEVRLPNTSANFANYAGLKLAIADWLDRPDLTNAIPNYIDLAEAKFQRKYRSVTSLSNSNTTNWLLLNHPDAYLYGALVESAPYIKDDARLAVWQGILEERLAEIRIPDTSANFTSYAGMKLMVADWLERPDLDNAIPNFMTLAEIRLSRDLRLRTLLKVVTTSMAAGDPTVTLPSDYNAMRDLHIINNTVTTLAYMSPSQFFNSYTSIDNGLPKSYTILSTEMQFAPIPDSAYTLQMLYYAIPIPLSVFNTTNGWLINCPDLYLYATLLEAAPYLSKDPASAGKLLQWTELYKRGVGALTISDDEGEYAGTSITVTLSPR